MSTDVLQPSLSYLEQRVLLRSRSERWRDLYVSSGLLLVVLAAHIVSVNSGLFMKDYWHRAVIRSRGWEMRDQLLSDRFELPGQINHLWWQEKPLSQPTCRPVAMYIMKAEYLLTGGRVWAQHVLSLLWHTLACMLVFHVVRWLMIARPWCFLAGALVAVSPHSVVTVGWLSARSELAGAVFFLGAFLAYANASAVEHVRRSRRSHRLYQVGWESVHISWLTATAILWILSILCWEPALILPALLILLDVGYGGRALLIYRAPVHLAMVSVAAAFTYWRFVVFPEQFASPFPPTWPEGWHTVPWAAGRLLQLLVGLLLGQPLLSEVLRLEILAKERILPLLLMALILVPVLAWYEYASRTLRCRLLWPLWMVVILAVCAPSFVLPPIGYLPFVGCAIMCVIMLSQVQGRVLRIMGILLACGILGPFVVTTLLWRGVMRSEQLLYADAYANAPRPMPGGQAFFINLPLAGLYAPVAMQEMWSLAELKQPPDLAGHVLTFSPSPLMMAGDCVIEQPAENQLVVSTSGASYFSGVTGQILRLYTHNDAPFTAGTVVQGEVFDTEVLEADEEGVRKLKFTFVQPLASQNYQFYLSSAKRPLYRWQPRPVPGPLSDNDAQLFTQARSADANLSATAKHQVAQRTRAIAIQLASPIQQLLEQDPELEKATSIDQLQEWWQSVGASRLIQERREWIAGHRAMLRDRDRTLGFIRRARNLLPLEVLTPEGPAVPSIDDEE